MTDEYTIYDRLVAWGYTHARLCRGVGEYARDDYGGDGVCKVQGNTNEGFWGLLRSWLRPHRGFESWPTCILPLFFQMIRFGLGSRENYWRGSKSEPQLARWWTKLGTEGNVRNHSVGISR
jgi:hypothetical protein